jgi:hypothetical protein
MLGNPIQSHSGRKCDPDQPCLGTKKGYVATGVWWHQSACTYRAGEEEQPKVGIAQALQRGQLLPMQHALLQHSFLYTFLVHYGTRLRPQHNLITHFLAA